MAKKRRLPGLVKLPVYYPKVLKSVGQRQSLRCNNLRK
jgi:hypothetical protein